MLVAALGAYPGAQAGEKGGIRGTKTEGMNGEKNIQAREKGHRKRTS